MKRVRFYYKDLNTGKITRSDWIDKKKLHVGGRHGWDELHDCIRG